MTISTLANLIAFVESSNERSAMRHEPLYKPSIANIALLANALHCTQDTAGIICATSWGLYQIMGDNLVSQGLRTWPADYCADVNVQLLHFSEFCNRAGIDYSLSDVVSDPVKRLNFATHYNGPGNAQAYADRMLAVYQANV